MVMWWLKHLAVLFKGKMTFHSGIRNWKHQAEMVQKQSMRITIHLINDLSIKSERVLREAATWDKKITIYRAENWDVTRKWHFEVGIPAGGVLMGLVPPREGKEPLSKSCERFELDSNEQQGGRGRESSDSQRLFYHVFLCRCISAAAGSSPLQET